MNDITLLCLERRFKKADYTIGKLFVNGMYFCDTCEDTDRGLYQGMTVAEVKAIKIAGKTAIPCGTYEITMTHSPRFDKVLPLLNGVTGYDGVRIHSGNTAKDTEGCILPGKNTIKGGVANSKDTCDKLFPIISNGLKQGRVFITIC